MGTYTKWMALSWIQKPWNSFGERRQNPKEMYSLFGNTSSLKNLKSDAVKYPEGFLEFNKQTNPWAENHVQNLIDLGVHGHLMFVPFWVKDLQLRRDQEQQSSTLTCRMFKAWTCFSSLRFMTEMQIINSQNKRLYMSDIRSNSFSLLSYWCVRGP